MAPTPFSLDRILDHLLHGGDEVLANEFFERPEAGRGALVRVRALLELVSGPAIGAAVRVRLARLDAIVAAPRPPPAAPVPPPMASPRLEGRFSVRRAPLPAPASPSDRSGAYDYGGYISGSAGRLARLRQVALLLGRRVDRLRPLLVDRGGIRPVAADALPRPAPPAEPAVSMPRGRAGAAPPRRHRALLPGGGVLELVLAGAPGEPLLELRIDGLETDPEGLFATWLGRDGRVVAIGIKDGVGRLALVAGAGTLRLDARRTLELPLEVAV
jgi:hypothetical protein